MTPVAVLNDTKETTQKTEEDRKRDHKNALRRATYRRKKDRLIQDENLHALNISGQIVLCFILTCIVCMYVCMYVFMFEPLSSKYVFKTLFNKTTQLAPAIHHSRIMMQHFLLQLRSHLVSSMRRI